MKPLAISIALAFAVAANAERINQEGRILGPAPSATQPILFNTPEADAVVAAMQIMPVDSAWNEDISTRPLLSNSVPMIGQIQSDLSASRQTLRPFFEMNYVLVPDSQPAAQPIRFFNYANQSDLDGGTSPSGLYPIPPNLPVETWPRQTGTLTLSQWQQDTTSQGGDRHAIIVKPGAGFIWETWLTKLGGSAWEASNGAKFDLKTNTLRPAGWTSGDAAGLPMFPALVRYDECQRGMVEHALRLVVAKTQRAYIYPATHYASALTGINYPAMGQRARLKGIYVVPASWTKEEKAVLLALKKYGAIVADNGNFFSISVCPDNRFASGVFDHLQTITIDNFEFVQTTGPSQGPRSPGAPLADAGFDQTIPFGTPASLNGNVSTTGSVPTIQWKLYSGPGTVTFGNGAQAATTVAFSLPGSYTLLLSATDGVHAVAYDAVKIEVTVSSDAVQNGSDILVRFPTVTGHTYRIEKSDDLSPNSWITLADNVNGTGASLDIPDTNALLRPARFYRVRVLQ